MAASNLTNKLKVFAENTVNKQTDTEFTNEDQRDLGYAPNTVISSKVMNTALRQATLVNVALIEALKQLSVGDLVNPITFGSNTSVSDAKDAIVDAINKIKIPEASIADNVRSGAIVEETTTARKYKHGWQISQDLKKKMVFKETWVGTHMNNDVLYFGTTGILKGYYLVHGLTNESVNEGNGAVTEAGKLTITAGQTPATGAISGNLKRLTFETELGSDTTLSKVTSISGSSTDNQIPSAKAAYTAINTVATNLSTHIGKKDNPHEVTKTQVGLGNVTNDKQLKDSDKVTSISSSSTDTNIPSAKAVYDELAKKVDKAAGYGLSKNDFTDTLKTKLDGIEEGAQVNPTIIDNLNSTSSTSVLSAKQGKALNDGKVDKVSGKGLSTNDFTTTLKNKLDGIDTGAQKNPYSKAQLDAKFDAKANTLSKKQLVTINNAGYDNSVPFTAGNYDLYFIVAYDTTRMVQYTHTVYSYAPSTFDFAEEVKFSIPPSSSTYSYTLYRNRLYVANHPSNDVQTIVYGIKTGWLST